MRRLGRHEVSAGPDKVTVVLDWTPNTNHGGIYLAQAKGWYRRAGLDVKVIEPGDTPSLEILGAGKADVALSVQEEVVPARAKGLPVVSIGAVIQHNTSSLVSLRSDRIATPGDLPGHTYGGFGGLLEKALVKKLTSCAGGDADEGPVRRHRQRRLPDRPGAQSVRRRLDLRRMGRHPAWHRSTSCRPTASRSSRIPTAYRTGTRRSSRRPKR